MNNRKKLHRELKELIVEVGWTHEVHLMKANQYAAYSKAFRIVRIVFASLTSAGLVGLLLVNDVYILKIIIAVLSFVTVAMNGFDKSVDYDKLSIKEQTDAIKYGELEKEANSLLFDVVYELKEIDALEKKMMELREQEKTYRNGADYPVSKRILKKVTEKVKEKTEADNEEESAQFISSKLLELK